MSEYLKDLCSETLPPLTTSGLELFLQNSLPHFEKIIAKSVFENASLWNKAMIDFENIQNQFLIDVSKWNRSFTDFASIHNKFDYGFTKELTRDELFGNAELSAHNLIVQQGQQLTALEYLEIRPKLLDFLSALKQFPEFLPRLGQFLRNGKHVKGGKRISHKIFINQYLMQIPIFRKLLELAECEIVELYKCLVKILHKASDWLWKRCLKFSRKFRRIPAFLFSIKHHKSELEKLWPLLMAFKNA